MYIRFFLLLLFVLNHCALHASANFSSAKVKNSSLLFERSAIDFKMEVEAQGKLFKIFNKSKKTKKETRKNRNFVTKQPDSVLNKFYSKSITLLDNKNNLIPFKSLDTLTFASVSIGADAGNEFQSMLKNYIDFKNFTLSNKYSSDTVFNNILTKASAYKVVVVGLHDLSTSEGNSFGISPNTITFLEKLRQKTNVVVVAFGSPYALRFVQQTDYAICAFEDNRFTREAVPQMLFGALSFEGSLPVAISGKYMIGHGIKTESLGRLKYGTPETEGVDSEVLKNIDEIVYSAIKKGSTPGAQVLVARKGTVIFKKSYGFLTYDSIQPVTDDVLYDIASITKVAATVQTLMFLKDQGLLDLNKKLSDYLPELKGTNKANLILKDVLIHQAGLTPFIPHWTKTVSHQGFDSRFYSEKKSDKFPLDVARGLYGTAALADSVWKWSVRSELLRKRKNQINFDYKYSDVGYLFLKRIAENLLNQPLDQFLEQNFYLPLGASSLTYLPLNKFPVERIAPTEDDKDFRRQLIRGSVHDQGAAMVGGVAGHAGLFSNANDLVKVLQMNLNKGQYGGQKFLSEQTITMFTQRQKEGNRRGLGWDKPAIEYDGQTAAHASSKTFGHTGFSGTAAWVDPEKEVIYIFLSNRIYPYATNNSLLKDGVRTRIQEEIYKAIISYKTKNNLQ